MLHVLSVFPDFNNDLCNDLLLETTSTVEVFLRTLDGSYSYKNLVICAGEKGVNEEIAEND